MEFYERLVEIDKEIANLKYALSTIEFPQGHLTITVQLHNSDEGNEKWNFKMTEKLAIAYINAQLISLKREKGTLLRPYYFWRK